jgi:hypothetical protein
MGWQHSQDTGYDPAEFTARILPAIQHLGVGALA